MTHKVQKEFITTFIKCQPLSDVSMVLSRIFGHRREKAAED
jgi:hypothetical protein